jgi:hypothetical protein
MRQYLITKLDLLMYEDADTRPRHDGNIAAATWTCGDDMAIVRYTYDRLKRLTYASYNGKSSEDYSAKYGYDDMGNVRTLVRMSGTNVSATANGNADVYSSGEGINKLWSHYHDIELKKRNK